MFLKDCYVGQPVSEFENERFGDEMSVGGWRRSLRETMSIFEREEPGLEPVAGSTSYEIRGVREIDIGS